MLGLLPRLLPVLLPGPGPLPRLHQLMFSITTTQTATIIVIATDTTAITDIGGTITTVVDIIAGTGITITITITELESLTKNQIKSHLTS